MHMQLNNKKKKRAPQPRHSVMLTSKSEVYNSARNVEVVGRSL